MKLTGRVVAVGLDVQKRIVTIHINESDSPMYSNFKVEGSQELGEEVDIVVTPRAKTAVAHGA